jgi:predicted O-linked N-acetylglucosamine transferase (SPINDLY family)
MGDAVRNMHAFAERAGVAPTRLLFVPVVDQPTHFRRLRSMDLALDTLRLGGGATTMDAIWVGLPILTACTHENYLHPSRGIFGGLEMSEEVLTDVPAFIDRAIHLRNNPNSLAVLKQKFLTRRGSLLSFNPPRYAAALQAALRSMWARHLRGETPATFTV